MEISNHFVGVADAVPEDGGEDHPDVFWEGIVMEVVEVDADFIGEDHLVIVFLRVGLLSEEVLLIAVFQGSETEHIGTWTYDAHIADQHVPEFRKFDYFSSSHIWG